jgi:hypothetical protein
MAGYYYGGLAHYSVCMGLCDGSGVAQSVRWCRSLKHTLLTLEREKKMKNVEVSRWLERLWRTSKKHSLPWSPAPDQPVVGEDAGM